MSAMTLPKGVRCLCWMDGSTYNLNPKRHYFIVFKIDDAARTLRYGASIYVQRKPGDTLDDGAHWETAMYRFNTVPVIIQGLPEHLLTTARLKPIVCDDVSREDGDEVQEEEEEEDVGVVWLNDVRSFLSSVLLAAGCHDTLTKRGPRAFPPPLQSISAALETHVQSVYEFDQDTSSIVLLSPAAADAASVSKEPAVRGISAAPLHLRSETLARIMAKIGELEILLANLNPYGACPGSSTDSNRSSRSIQTLDMPPMSRYSSPSSPSPLRSSFVSDAPSSATSSSSSS